jgi:hypothetical protein
MARANASTTSAPQAVCYCCNPFWVGIGIVERNAGIANYCVHCASIGREFESICQRRVALATSLLEGLSDRSSMHHQMCLVYV